MDSKNQNSTFFTRVLSSFTTSPSVGTTRVDESQPMEVNHVLAEIMEALDNEEKVDVDSLIKQYPEYKKELISYLELANKLDHLIEQESIEELQNPGPPEIPGFEIFEEVGKGGMGVVYRARQENLNREVALKFLPQSLLEDKQRLKRFQFEATVAGRIHDSNILPVYDVFFHNNQPVLVLPFIRGCDLEQIIRHRNAVLNGKLDPEAAHPWAKLPPKEYTEKILSILDQVSIALSRIHQHGILHRDIKPSNILVDKEGRAWLSDFGLARLIDNETITVDGAFLGTPGYMSPEQCADPTKIDFCSDVFSTGVTYYYALTGELPFERKFLSGKEKRPISLRKLNPQVPAYVAKVVTKGLSLRRYYRYKDGHGFLRDWHRSREGKRPQGRMPVTLGTRITVWGGLAVIIAGWLAYHSSPIFLLNRTDPDQVQGLTEGRQTISFLTFPTADRGVIVPLDPDTEDPLPDQKIVLEKRANRFFARNLLPGPYLVVVEKKGHGFHEVFRQVPKPTEDKTHLTYLHLRWFRVNKYESQVPSITIPKIEKNPKEMVLLDGVWKKKNGEETFVDKERKPLHPFFMAQRPVQSIPFLMVMSKYKIDMRMTYVRPDKNSSNSRGHRFDVSVQYAETAGVRLPSAYEFEFAATNAGTTRFPWGNDLAFLAETDEEQFQQKTYSAEKEFDCTTTEKPIFGLFSGSPEWTSTKYVPETKKDRLRDFTNVDTRVVMGLSGRLHLPLAVGNIVPSNNVSALTAKKRTPHVRKEYSNHQAIRCVQSVKPRFLE